MKQKILPFSARNTDTDHASRVGAVSRRNALRLSGLVGIGALAPHLLGACAGGDEAAVDPRIGFSYPNSADYSALSWTDAFKAAHGKFSREYAFGEWKGVDWPSLYSKYESRIVQAQAAADESAYYLALHQYLFSIPDGHLGLTAKNSAVPTALAKARAGGGFGMAVAELDDRRVIAAAVIRGGQADLAGIAVGAEIIGWGGQAARVAIGNIDVGAIPYKLLTGAPGGEAPQATREHYRLEQARLLTRGAIGDVIEVVFRNPAAPVSRTTSLVAVDDGGQTFSLLNFAARPELSDQIDYRILPQGYGYVLVRMELDLRNPADPTRIYQEFRKAVSSFVSAKVPGVIIDLRGNYGGSDQLAADICGFFYATPSFYEAQEYFDKRDGRFLRITLPERGPDPFVSELSITPQSPHYAGPVVVLVNPFTKSSGEGPPLYIAQLASGKVIGFHGTNGSFGMVGGSIALPAGYAIEYAYGRSIDQRGRIQLDSRDGVGGVAPNPRVPMTMDNALAFAAGTDVVLDYAITYLNGSANR